MNKTILVTVSNSTITTPEITQALRQMDTVKIELQGSFAGHKNYLLIIPLSGTLKYELSVQTSNQRILTEVTLFRQMMGMHISNISELVKKLQYWVRI